MFSDNGFEKTNPLCKCGLFFLKKKKKTQVCLKIIIEYMIKQHKKIE